MHPLQQVSATLGHTRKMAHDQFKIIDKAKVVFTQSPQVLLLHC